MSKTLIKDVASVFSGATPSTGNADYYDGDIVWFTPKDLADQKVKYISCSARKITQKGLDNCSAVMLPAYTVLLSTRAPIGLISISTTECCTNQGFKSIVCDQSKLLPEYLYYYLKFHIKEIENLGSGTTFKEVSKASIENYGIDVPDIVLQKEICSILGSIDSKISTNNAIISELESMAKDIYDYWFVQFDFPDENGKPYRSSGGKMVWNEELKREIPEGWKANYISNLVSLKNGINYDKANQGTGKEYQIINVRNISNSSLCIDKSKLDKIILSPTNADRYLIEKNSILIARSGIPGAIRIIDIDQSSNIIFCGFIILCTPNNPDYMLYYLYSLKKYEGTNATKTGGSILQNVSQDTIGSLCILIPESIIVERFNSIIEPIHKRIMNALEENAELTSLRDFLLPLLMNGQVKIGDVSD